MVSSNLHASCSLILPPLFAKFVYRSSKSDWIGCNEVFGGFGRGVRWDWFLPTRVEFHGISRALILGYVEEGEDATGDGDVEMKDIKEEEVRSKVDDYRKKRIQPPNLFFALAFLLTE